jgi:hypothetical protein
LAYLRLFLSKWRFKWFLKYQSKPLTHAAFVSSLLPNTFGVTTILKSRTPVWTLATSVHAVVIPSDECRYAYGDTQPAASLEGSVMVILYATFVWHTCVYFSLNGALSGYQKANQSQQPMQHLQYLY